MDHHQEVWVKCRPISAQHRVTYLFDPEFYLSEYNDIEPSGLDPYGHYNSFGRFEGRFPTLYRKISTLFPHAAEVVAGLVIDPSILECIDIDRDHGIHLAFELINLGNGIDSEISNFSADYYKRRYPDIARADLNPFLHFVCHGNLEGREDLAALRQNHISGLVSFDEKKPTCILALHELSNTGAPTVGVELAEQASKEFNVVVISLKSGPLLNKIKKYCVELIISDHPRSEIPFLASTKIQMARFAILNSVECWSLIPYFVESEIPFAFYIHEYLNYTFPRYKAIFVAAFSDLVIFSSDHVRTSWSDLFNDINFNASHHTSIIPQREIVFSVPSLKQVSLARKELSEIVGLDLSDYKIVCGAGHLQWRKGVDIFIMASQAFNVKQKIVFIWIGDGLNVEDMNFGVWADYHLQQVRANDPKGNIFLIPAGAHYRTVLRSADVMFLSSRLDPLPNVVYDALQEGTQVVFFDGATGFSDNFYKQVPALHAVPYGNLLKVTSVLASVGRKGAHALRSFEMRQNKVSPFKSIAKTLSRILNNTEVEASEQNAIDVPLLFTNLEADRTARVRERRKLTKYKRNLIWKSSDEARAILKKSDNWVHQRIEVKDFKSVSMDTPVGYSLHIHAFYPDLLDGLFREYAASRGGQRLIITTNTDEKAREVERITKLYCTEFEVRVTENRGRDILPFMQLFNEAKDSEDNDIWAHLHLKKSYDTTSTGHIWREFLYSILLGGENYISNAMTTIGHQDVGLVAPFDPYRISWTASRPLLSQFQSKFPDVLPTCPILFPIGNMFWTRVAVARKMAAIFGEEYAWPNEPIATDGTEFHFIERIWPAVAASLGKKSVFIEKLDQPRV